MRLLTFMQMAEEKQEIYFDTIQQEMNLTEDDIEAYVIEGGIVTAAMLLLQSIDVWVYI